MKRIFMTLMILALATSVSFAQVTKQPPAKAPKATTAAQKISGKVDSVTLANPATGTKAVIVVTGVNNLKTTLMVNPTAIVMGADGKVTTLGNVTKDENVIVRYMTAKNGDKQANYIKIVK